MSNDKRMDFEKAVRTVLEKNPGLKAEFLIPELKEKTGLSRSTIYDHLCSLELKKRIFRERGHYWLEKPIHEHVKDVKHARAVEKEEEADLEIIKDCMKIVQSDELDEVRVARAKQIERFCYHKRTAYTPQLLNFLRTSLDDESPEVRKNLASALANMLWYEQRREPRDVHIIRRIIEENIENVTRLASRETNYEVRFAVLEFLGRTCDIRALDPIFEIIMTCSEKEYEKMKDWIQESLFTPRCILTKTLRRDVSKRLDRLLKDPDEQVRSRAKELHKYMISSEAMRV